VKKKPIKILKKLTSSVRFRFYKPETEKTKPNQTQTEKNRKKIKLNQKKNRAKPKKPSQTGLNRFLS
jgi:Ni,Fe-hydrogenase I large subunit